MFSVKMKNIRRLLGKLHRNMYNKQASKDFHISSKSKFGRISRTVKSIWQQYLMLMERYRWKAHCINTGALVGFGDILSQCITYKRITYESFDFTESARYFGVGLLLLGPFTHTWYSVLNRLVSPTGFRAAITKFTMDAIFYLPLYVAAIITVMGALTGESRHEIANDFKSTYVPIMTYCYMGWPWIQLLLNSRYVPLRHRVFVMNVSSLFYNMLIASLVEMGRRQGPDRRNQARLMQHVEDSEGEQINPLSSKLPLSSQLSPHLSLQLQQMNHLQLKRNSDAIHKTQVDEKLQDSENSASDEQLL